MQAHPSKRANQKVTVFGLEQPCVACGVVTDIDSKEGSHFTNKCKSGPTLKISVGICIYHTIPLQMDLRDV